MASLDRDRLLRLYAPRLERALAGPKVPGGAVNDTPQALGGLLNVQVVGDVCDGSSDAEEPVETEQTGVMIAFYLPADAAEELALPAEGAPEDLDIESPQELHLTLAYLGTAGVDVAPDQLDGLVDAVQQWAASTGPVSGTVSGIGVFNNEDTVVTYASYDSPALPGARQELVAALGRAGLKVSGDHGFTPHITLAYGDARGVPLPRLQITFGAVTIAYGGQQTTVPLGEDAVDNVAPDQAKRVPLGEDIPEGDQPDDNNEDETDRDPKSKDQPRPPIAASQLVVNDRQVALINLADRDATESQLVAWRPIVTTSGSRTVITGPAETAAEWAAAPNPNPHMLWMQGRFVGAERPNRNGAFWSTGDLEFGRPSVANGPLNWLHEERHVIGTIADARLVRPGSTEQASETSDPHIAALAGIWSWIYPQEASVVQMASDAGCLAYSMECIAQAIQCVGDAGCGQTFGYMEVAGAGGGCDHLRDRASVRRLVNPTFLGGAVIVPPTRPGWADADASVMKEASSMAERAYEQAGRPDIAADTWEQLMAGVVTYTRNAQ